MYRNEWITVGLVLTAVLFIAWLRAVLGPVV